VQGREGEKFELDERLAVPTIPSDEFLSFLTQLFLFPF